MRRPAPFAPQRAKTAGRTAPRTRVAAALALVRCELEKDRLAREKAHLTRRSGAVARALSAAAAQARSLGDRLRQDD